jgi:hypothetical protein
MIRFRHIDDEKNYIALRSELFRVIASRLPPELATAAMRDLGKLEGLLYYEGTRQGFACAALARLETGLPDIEKMKYPQVLAHVYGSADSPLAAVEQEHLDRLDPMLRSQVAQHPWLANAPMRYAPTTYAEFMGMQEPPRPMLRIDAPGPPIPVVKPQAQTQGDLLGDAWDDSTASAATPHREQGREPTPADIAKLTAMFEQDDASSPPAHSPEVIERARDAIAVMTKAGYKAQSWPGFVLALQRETGMDAAVLDLVLCGPQGLTMLSQMHVDVRPGASISADDLLPTEGILASGPR